MGNMTENFTTEKAQNFGSDVQTITTLEIAEMMELNHWQVLRKLEGREDNSTRRRSKVFQGIIQKSY